jgi:hypothetical protein
MHRELADGNVATSFPGREDLMQNPQAPTEKSLEDEEDQLIEDNDEDEEEVITTAKKSPPKRDKNAEDLVNVNVSKKSTTKTASIDDDISDDDFDFSDDDFDIED